MCLPIVLIRPSGHDCLTVYLTAGHVLLQSVVSSMAYLRDVHHDCLSNSRVCCVVVHGVIYGLSAWCSPSVHSWNPSLLAGPLQVQWQLQEQILWQLLQGCLGGRHFPHCHSCCNLHLPAHWVRSACFTYLKGAGALTAMNCLVKTSAVYCSQVLNEVLSAVLPGCLVLNLIPAQGMPSHMYIIMCVCIRM